MTRTIEQIQARHSTVESVKRKYLRFRFDLESIYGPWPDITPIEILKMLEFDIKKFSAWVKPELIRRLEE